MKIINRQAKFDYEIKERIEAGIMLSGAEVKSTKLGQADLSTAFCKFKPGRFGPELWVYNLHIYPYEHADNTDYDPKRARKLLVHKKEMVALQSRMKQARLLLIPTALYTHSGLIKLELGLARGKRIYEKREVIKKRDIEREQSL